MKMRRLKLTALLAMLGAGAMAQETATATATATIVTPISIAKTVDMNFGNVAVQSTTGGTVVLSPEGTRTTTGAVTLPVVGGTITAASFTVEGQGSYTYAITLPTTDLVLSDGAAHTMIVKSFTSTPSGTGELTAGSQVLNVGATLEVAAAQVAGTYVSGTPFNVTVNYN